MFGRRRFINSLLLPRSEYSEGSIAQNASEVTYDNRNSQSSSLRGHPSAVRRLQLPRFHSAPSPTRRGRTRHEICHAVYTIASRSNTTRDALQISRLIDCVGSHTTESRVRAACEYAETQLPNENGDRRRRLPQALPHVHEVRARRGRIDQNAPQTTCDGGEYSQTCTITKQKQHLPTETDARRRWTPRVRSHQARARARARRGGHDMTLTKRYASLHLRATQTGMHCRSRDGGQDLVTFVQ